jgi:glycosyltransferase involved in cell wall biosynthesis
VNPATEPLPISALVLARDAASDLEALLPALAFARERVVVVDAASDEATRRTAERLGARVFVRALDGFGAQRGYALSQCQEPWVLWIDTDERLPSDAARVLERAIADDAHDGFRLARIGYFLGRRIRHCGWRGERVLRLFRRERARFDEAPVHERVEVKGAIGALPLAIEQHSYRDWADCRDKLVRYAAAGAERARRAGRRARAWEVVARPPLRFLRMYVLQLGFLDGGHGAVLCALAAAQVFLKYAELWAAPARGPTAREPGA